MRIRMKGHAMPPVKLETDAGVHDIGECHHDITGLGAKNAVLNAFREMLIGQDPVRHRQADHANDVACFVSRG